MKLKHQLILLQDKQIKVGSLISFFYCEKCDKNILNTIEYLSNKEYERITNILNEALYLKQNFEEVWKKKIERKIQTTKASQQKMLKTMASEEIRCMRKVLKENGSKEKINKEKAKLLTEKLIKKYAKLNKKIFKKQIKKVVIKMLKAKEKNYEKTIKTIEEYIPRIENWIPYLEREVIEVYDSIVDENCKIIKITGLEKSKYWDKEEYNRGEGGVVNE